MDSPSSAPALERGIRIVRFLEDGIPRAFTDIARGTRIPKASLTRLLKTLAQLTLVERDPDTAAFTARARLLPLPRQKVDFERFLPRALQSLAETTGQTAEWYVPAAPGMILVQHYCPPLNEVIIRAGVGFVRPWQGEWETVSALGNACFRPAPSGRARFWTYVRDGLTSTLSKEQLATRLAKARKTGVCIDPCCNTNGVRRSGIVIFEEDQPFGILVLAEVVAPSQKKRNRGALVQELKKTAQELSAYL